MPQSVVGDADARQPAARRYPPRCMPRPGIEGVFHEFFDHGGGVFDHLPGGDAPRDGRQATRRCAAELATFSGSEPCMEFAVPRSAMQVAGGRFRWGGLSACPHPLACSSRDSPPCLSLDAVERRSRHPAVSSGRGRGMAISLERAACCPVLSASVRAEESCVAAPHTRRSPAPCRYPRRSSSVARWLRAASLLAFRVLVLRRRETRARATTVFRDDLR